MNLPDRDKADEWTRRLRVNGAIMSLPHHIAYRLAALSDAAEARYVDVQIPNDRGPVDARIVVLTDNLIIECQSQQIDVRMRTGSGQATTSVTIRPITDVTQLVLAGEDIDWVPGQFGELDPTLGSLVATFNDGTVLELPQSLAARSEISVAIEMLRRGLLANLHG